ncbi:MAG: M23 family metallopeptidase [Longimicrobiales bacterium]
MRLAVVRPRAWAVIACALLVACDSSERAAAQGPTLPPFLELRVPKPPAVVAAEDGAFLAHELHVTNFAAQPVTLKQVEVATASREPRVLLVVGDSALANVTARPGPEVPAVERTELPGGARAVVYLWVPVESEAGPAAVRHRVTLEEAGADGVRTRELDGPEVSIAAAPVPIGPPLRGGPWLTANGPSNDSGHRRALIPVGGVVAIAQRFAIDYVMVGDDGRTFNGDRLENESYHAYGTDALAVADGVVAAVKDGIPENVPGPRSRAVPITLETVGGNHVIIDLGGGRYAFYAHLQPGSLRVALGDRVTRGQVIGLVGNSGNSTEPHLHFHLSDGNSPLGSEGIPYVYDAFETEGRCRTIGGGCERTAPVTHRGELPLANVLVRFPE